MLIAGTGCLAPQPDRWSYPTPPPSPADVRRAASPVVPAYYAALNPPKNTPTAAQPQPLPQPRPAEPEAKPGSGPPPPPKALPPVSGSPPSLGGPLALDEVLDAVERHYPLLRAVEQERAVAGGRLISSMGAFDLNLAATADGQGTTYDNFRSGVGLSQGLPVGGLGLFAGYRTGSGEFPTYNLGQKTADGGEFRAGVSIPLMRDRDIDRPRGGLISIKQQPMFDLQQSIAAEAP